MENAWMDADLLAPSAMKMLKSVSTAVVSLDVAQSELCAMMTLKFALLEYAKLDVEQSVALAMQTQKFASTVHA